MNVTLYENFVKRKNSTKQPTGGTTINCVMKNGCSVDNPVFLIDGVNLNVNYVGFNNAFYFVDDIILSRNNIYEVHCTIDVLATYKTAIGQSSQFVERSESDFDPLIPDKLLSSSLDIVAQHNNGTQLSLDGAGCYLINTFSKDGVNVYAYTDLDQINGILNNNALGIDDNALQALLTTIGANIFDVSAYVSNVRWIPIDIDDLSGAVETVKVSFFNLVSGTTSFQAKRITSRQYTDDFTINPPANFYNDFRAYDDSYSKYAMRLPGIGVIYIPAIYFADPIYGIFTVDIMTGRISYTLYSQPDSLHQSIIGKYDGQVGIEIPYSTSRVDVGQMLQAFLPPVPQGMGVTSGDIMSSAIGTAVQWVQNGVLDVTNAFINHPFSINNSAGNMSEIKNHHNIDVSVTNFATKIFPIYQVGRPLYEYRVINTLSGFIKCSMPSISIGGTSQEKDMINAFLSSGFYFE